MCLGLGVDDAFVLASEFGHHTMLDAELSIAKRVSRTACSGGMSFPIVSATDALASLVRTTVLPALDWLCTWAGVATIFTGCLCANCACGHWHDVTGIPCALHNSLPDEVVALSSAEKSWAFDCCPDSELPALRGQQWVVLVHSCCLCAKWTCGHWPCNNDSNWHDVTCSFSPDWELPVLQGQQ